MESNGNSTNQDEEINSENTSSSLHSETSSFNEGYMSSHQNSSNEESIEEENEDDIFLYENTELKVSGFSYLILLYSIQHNLSRKAREDLLEVFRSVLPVDNNVPTISKLEKITSDFEISNTHYSLCSKCHCRIENGCCWNEECLMNNQKVRICSNFYIMDIESQVARIIKGEYLIVFYFFHATSRTAWAVGYQTKGCYLRAVSPSLKKM